LPDNVNKPQPTNKLKLKQKNATQAKEFQLEATVEALWRVSPVRCSAAVLRVGACDVAGATAKTASAASSAGLLFTLFFWRQVTNALSQ
jgi:hypothetical protein